VVPHCPAVTDDAAKPATPERARLFVALELPAPVRAALGQWRSDRLGQVDCGLRMVRLDDLHVTLCFLGSQPANEILSIASACRCVAGCPRPVLTVGSPAWLPPRRPRVLAVDLDDPQGALGRAQAELSSALVRGGWYEPERRPFRVHVTVARVAGRARVAAVELPPPAPISFVGSSVVLIRSRLARAGSSYEALANVELGSGRAPPGDLPPTAEAASRSTSPAPDRSRS
jgi:RNA 2',3'-cyclic 3'-phosphodiesterase